MLFSSLFWLKIRNYGIIYRFFVLFLQCPWHLGLGGITTNHLIFAPNTAYDIEFAPIYDNRKISPLKSPPTANFYPQIPLTGNFYPLFLLTDKIPHLLFFVDISVNLCLILMFSLFMCYTYCLANLCVILIFCIFMCYTYFWIFLCLILKWILGA